MYYSLDNKKKKKCNFIESWTGKNCIFGQGKFVGNIDGQVDILENVESKCFKYIFASFFSSPELKLVSLELDLFLRKLNLLNIF